MARAVKRSRHEAMADDTSVDTPRFGEDNVKASGGILSRFGARLFSNSRSNIENVSPVTDRYRRSTSAGVAVQKDVDAVDAHSGESAPAAHDLDPLTMKPAFVSCPDFATEDLGATILFATDEFSGLAHNLLKSTKHSPTETATTPYGVIGDWWGTRRRRRGGHEWVVIQFGEPVFIRGFDIDTHGTPAFTPNISVEAGYFTGLDAEVSRAMEGFEQTGGLASHQLEPLPEEMIKAVQDIVDGKDWIELVPIQRIRFTHDGHHYFGVKTKQEERRLTHIRVNLMPDGAVSRFRAYGETLSAFGNLKLLASANTSKTINMLDPKLGAWPLWASSARDESLQNLLKPYPPTSCRDGWCTQSQQFRQPLLFECQKEIKYSSDDVVIIKLAGRCVPQRFEIDTSFFLGDAPYAVTIEAVDAPEMLKLPMLQQIAFFRNRYREGIVWIPIREKLLVKPNAVHTLDVTTHDTKSAGKAPTGGGSGVKTHTYHQIEIPPDLPAITHLRLTIIPDGGLSRVRVWGTPVDVLPSDLTRGSPSSQGFVLESNLATPGGSIRRAGRRSTMWLYNNLDNMFPGQMQA